MMKNERMKKLTDAGVNTGKYFSFELPEGVTPGTTVKIMFDENGAPKIMNEETETNLICEQIIEDGYVRNTKLHRRWVMAQMFRMLNYKSWDGKKNGYNEALKCYSYYYTFEMMLEEVRVLSKLERRDYESFIERKHFFTKDVVVAVCNDYMKKLKDYVESLPTKKCKGVPYKRIEGKDIFVADLDKKIYCPLRSTLTLMKRYGNTYDSLYSDLKIFMKHMVKLPYNTKKSPDWIDAYKGAGAYYTCKNLIMFHRCCVKYGNSFCSRDESIDVLKSTLDAYKGEGWRMFAFMKKLIADNNFDFNKRMNEIYNK